MNKHGFWLSAALVVLLIAPAKISEAQRGSAGVARVAAPRMAAVGTRMAPVRVATAPRMVVGRTVPAIVRSHSRISPNGFFGFDGTGMFGLLNPGFGFNTLGVANQDLWLKAAIDPATQWRLFEKQRFFHGIGAFAPGFYLLDGGAYYEPMEPVEAEQAPAPEQPAPSEATPAESASEEQHGASQPAAPVEDVGQFILVLRNGTQLQTVAFTRAKDRIVYVTTDGLRRTLALADLDTDATIRVNEERGTPLQIQL